MGEAGLLTWQTGQQPEPVNGAVGGARNDPFRGFCRNSKGRLGTCRRDSKPLAFLRLIPVEPTT